MLKLRPDTKSGGGGGGGGGGGAVGFWPDTEKRGGGGGGGGVPSVSGPIRKAGGGGVLLVSGPMQARIQNVLEEGAEKLARAKFLATTPILETEGGARAP